MAEELQFQLTAEAAERYDAVSLPLMEPFVDVLASRAAPADAVLDLACGTGYTARAVVRTVGFSGQIAAVDVNPAMVDVARRRGAGAFEVRQAPAHQLPYPDSQFDTVLCQQGLQFFPDLPAGLSEIRRVLRPGGLLAATAWAARDRSPYFEAQGQAFEDAAGPSKRAGISADFGRVFGLDGGRFTAVASSVGLIDVTVEDFVAKVHLPPLPEFAARHLSALPFVAGIIEQNPQALNQIALAVTEGLRNYRTPDGGAGVPFASQVLCARKAPGF